MNKYRVRIRNIFFGSIVIAITLFTTLVISSYSNNFGLDFFPKNRDELGQFGDYFGGTLNPIFSFASFIALLITIFYQSKELKLSRKELKLTRDELSKSASALTLQNKAIELQSFEQTFFSWLNTYRDLLNSLSKAPSSNTTVSGREALRYLWENNLNSRAIYLSMCIKEYGQFIGLDPIFGHSFTFEQQSYSNYKKIEIIAEGKSDLVANHIHKIWCLMYEQEEYQLDSLFRTAYKLINWIDTQQSERLDDNQKWLYISIFRSQLSRVEMVFLFYNGLTSSSKKFKSLIEKYALFDNLTFDSDIGITVMRKYFAIESNYAQTAFCSDLAKNAQVTANHP